MSIDLPPDKSNIRQTNHNENIFSLTIGALSKFFEKKLLTFYFKMKQKSASKNSKNIKAIKNNNLNKTKEIKRILRDKVNVSIKINSKGIAVS